MNAKQSVPDKSKILVVGTTSDYIDWIEHASPGRALFLTDPKIREAAEEAAPDPEDELTIRLDNFESVKSALESHLKIWHQQISGIACFDCESLELASMLAADRGIEYPDIQTIRNCRDKYVSKKLWQDNGVLCPKTIPINTLEEAIRFLVESPEGIVLKPFYGSGSELVFQCRTKVECKIAFQAISDGLAKRSANPIFRKSSSCQHLMLAEKFVTGPELSCDFILENGGIRIIRMTGKIKSKNRPFGTVSGYILPAHLPKQTDPAQIDAVLLKGAQALGIKRGICMVDFILTDRGPSLIEMTPRPGGDCIPFLLKEAGNLDILSLALDFAEHKPLGLNGSTIFKPHIGIRIHAQKSGVYKGCNTELLTGEKRIKKIHLIRKPGHKVTLPPNDYDSWLLGHLIIEPDSGTYPETQCFLIGKRLQVEIEG